MVIMIAVDGGGVVGSGGAKVSGEVVPGGFDKVRMEEEVFDGVAGMAVAGKDDLAVWSGVGVVRLARPFLLDDG